MLAAAVATFCLVPDTSMPWFIDWLLALLVVLTSAPLYLVNFLTPLGFNGICRLQDFLSETARRRKYGKFNAHSKPAQLSRDAQLRIFSFLRARAAFGSSERLVGEWTPDAFSAGRDLAAARLVCRAWNDAATEVLYTEVTLVTPRACVVFARALKAHPRRAPLVRRIVFPELSRRVSYDNKDDRFWSETIHGSGGVRQLHFRAAMDQVVSRCTQATDVTFFQNTKELKDVPGLVESTPRLTHLAIHHLEHDGRLNIPFKADALTQFPHLEVLMLQRQRLELSESLTAISTLHTLRLGRCFLTPAALHALLAHLPALRVFSWRESAVPDVASMTVAELLAPNLDSLTELTLVHHEPSAHFWIDPRDLDQFTSLRRCTISAWMADKVQALPSSVSELIVTTSPSPSSMLRTARQRCKARLAAVQGIVRLQRSSPSLRSVQLWDTVALSHLAGWRAAAYMLRAILQPVSVEVAVNLFLDKKEEENVRKTLWRSYRKRRLLWQDVI
ncbi:hypothetical protein AURDEDRAFT_170546 [Auricularia subglabra TFB-10046 SS5]|nr:hypothetical protein AURDEDRAFT_170546 [Auricularia subglabra TFB-10046 SS5]